MFVDESGTHLNMSRAYARFPQGERAYSRAPYHPGERTNLIAALSTSGVQAPWLVTGGSVDTATFVSYVENILCPTLRPGQIVILDNYSIHTGGKVRELIEAKACKLLFLPTYSPDLMPIENALLFVTGPLRLATTYRWRRAPPRLVRPYRDFGALLRDAQLKPKQSGGCLDGGQPGDVRVGGGVWRHGDAADKSLRAGRLMNEPHGNIPPTTSTFLSRVVLAVGVVALALLSWQVAGILLLTFAGVLVGVILRTLVRLVECVMPLGNRWVFPLVVLLLLLTFVLLGWLLAPRLTMDINQLRRGIPAAVQHLEDELERYGWGQDLLGTVPSLDQLDLFGGSLLTRLTRAFSTTVGALANVGFVLFVGLFLASNPKMYREGALQLVPKARRARVREVLSEMIITLRWWLLGQLVSMSIIGVLTGLGLWLLGMPFALVVGVIAGLLEFVPVVGPFVAGALAVLLAFMQGPLSALYVLLLYLVIQQLESNVLTPLVHRYTVELAPALTLAAVLIIGSLFGFIGVFVATPLVAVSVVLVKMLYVEDVLGGSAKLPRKMLRQTRSK